MKWKEKIKDKSHSISENLWKVSNKTLVVKSKLL